MVPPVRAMVAQGSAAPEESFTVPYTLPVANCARTAGTSRSRPAMVRLIVFFVNMEISWNGQQRRSHHYMDRRRGKRRARLTSCGRKVRRSVMTASCGEGHLVAPVAI